MKLIFTHEQYPVGKSVFLAGPTPRLKKTRSWRAGAINLFERHGFDGFLYVPEFRDGARDNVSDDELDRQCLWEEGALERATVIMFWIPRRMPDMPSLTTNDEWGRWKDSGKVTFGAPPWAENVRYQWWWASRLGIETSTDLESLVEKTINKARFW